MNLHLFGRKPEVETCRKRFCMVLHGLIDWHVGIGACLNAGNGAADRSAVPYITNGYRYDHSYYRRRIVSSFFRSKVMEGSHNLKSRSRDRMWKYLGCGIAWFDWLTCRERHLVRWRNWCRGPKQSIFHMYYAMEDERAQRDVAKVTWPTF